MQKGGRKVMAFFKIVKTEVGEVARYKAEADLKNLIYYICEKSVYTELNALVPCSAEALTNQLLYCQRCSGKKLDSRALHFILSYDTIGWEWQMSIEKVIESVQILGRVANQFGLSEYQFVMGVHDNGKNRHIHIAINPVNRMTKRILHYNIWDYKNFLWELAKELYWRYGIALAPVSYISERGELRRADGEPILYQDRLYSHQPHIREAGKDRKHLLNPFA